MRSRRSFIEEEDEDLVLGLNGLNLREAPLVMSANSLDSSPNCRTEKVAVIKPGSKTADIEGIAGKADYVVSYFEV